VRNKNYDNIRTLAGRCSKLHADSTLVFNNEGLTNATREIVPASRTAMGTREKLNAAFIGSTIWLAGPPKLEEVVDLFAVIGPHFPHICA
jgi:hypothetical protein